MSLARVIWSSHADLSGSGPHKLISLCQALIHRHSPLAAVSCSTLIISLRLASHASLSSPFKSLLCWSPLFSRSVELGFSMVWSQGSAEYTASPFPEHNCWSCGTGFRSSSVPVTRVIWSSHAHLSGSGVFFFGRSFDLVSGQQYICACAVPHPLCT